MNFIPLPKKSLFLIIGLAVLAAALMLLSQILKPEALTIINSFPTEGEANVSLATLQITITFNHPIKNINEIRVNISPSLQITSQLSQDQQTLLLEPQQLLLPNQAYSINVLQTKDDQPLGLFSFTTESLPESAMGGKGDPGLVSKIHLKDQEDFPLLRWVPFSTQDFEVDYIGRTKLEVKVKTNQEAAKQGLETWMRSHGTEPQTHEIVYINP